MRWRRVEALLLAIGLCGALTPARAEPAPRLLEVWLNGERVDGFAPLMEDDGRWYATAETLARWRLRPADPPRTIAGVAHHGLQNWSPRFDKAQQRLALQAPPEQFLAQRLRLDGRSDSEAPLMEPLPGLAMDYSVNAERSGGQSSTAALLDLRGFGWSTGGLARASGVLRAGANPAGLPRWQRLDTSLQHSDPNGLWRASLGDAITCGGELAPALRFAGAQYGTDFSLRPDLVTQPLPSVSGSAQVPSGVDLLIDNRPAGSAQVGPGNYTLDQLPGVTGAGEIRVVQRDLLGVERVQVVPYYSSPRLLRQGLSEHCAEAGVLRRGYASASDTYGGGFIAGSLRHGLSDTLTLLGRAEAGQAVRAVHLGAHWVVAGAGVLSLQLGRSQADGTGAGQRTAIGFERVARAGSLSATIDTAGTGFRSLDGSRLPQRRTTLFAGTSIGQTSLSAGLVWQRGAQGQDTRVLTAGLQRRLGAHWHAGLSLYRRDGQFSAALLLTRALSPDTTLAARAQAGADAGLTVQAQRSEPDAGGLGWRLQGGSDALSALAGVSWLGQLGRVEAQATKWRHDPEAHLRVAAQGGVLWIGGQPMLGRTIGEAAAARVEIEGMGGVGVRLNHRDTAVTDAKGQAWVWGLQPWQENTLGVAADVLPLDVVLGVPELQVRPPAQTVVRVRFPARRTRSALVSVRLPDGSPVPPGARAYRAPGGAPAGDEGAPFAHGGQVWLTDLDDFNTLRVEGPQGLCRVSFALAPTQGAAATLGPFTCTP
ncbi:fimbria/pilus outer membrane usher protein [Hydrogenophaga sp. SNF1]|uniref:fimbria/pilus outer membrane usher protein n=1 Tax=Hydrogenophaga sp. SNF1 TaxID=3098762 RepID=UPI002ACBF211|nr:fimbria/pilus outer membrane usher protein [Hydrogenophaga sp. SNF1]WQB85519.1 fimbria/pilus outer membrane usher protein [Hydrogenophaga sp. SNF1]